MSEDIVKWIISHSGYRLDEKGYWRQLQTIPKVDDDENTEWVIVSIVNVPVDVLFTVWEGLVRELSEKQVELVKVKEEYNREEFEIVYKSDIDFKSLYGSTSEKVRKQHAKDVLSELYDKKESLELSIEWIKNYIPLIRECIRAKQS